MFRLFQNLVPTATQLHSYTAKTFLFLILMFSSNFVQAQCSSVVTLEDAIMYQSNNEQILEQTVFEIDLSASTKSEMYYYLIHTQTEPISGRFVKISY